MGDISGFTVDFKGGFWWLCCKFTSKKDIKSSFTSKEWKHSLTPAFHSLALLQSAGLRDT